VTLLEKYSKNILERGSIPPDLDTDKYILFQSLIVSRSSSHGDGNDDDVWLISEQLAVEKKCFKEIEAIQSQLWLVYITHSKFAYSGIQTIFCMI
jgi:hypothetical protein